MKVSDVACARKVILGSKCATLHSQPPPAPNSQLMYTVDVHATCAPPSCSFWQPAALACPASPCLPNPATTCPANKTAISERQRAVRPNTKPTMRDMNRISENNHLNPRARVILAFKLVRETHLASETGGDMVVTMSSRKCQFSSQALDDDHLFDVYMLQSSLTTLSTSRKSEGAPVEPSTTAYTCIVKRITHL